MSTASTPEYDVDNYPAFPSSGNFVLTKLSVPTASYQDEPSKTIVINLSLQPRVVITCSTLSGYELGYFGWDSGAVDITFEGEDEVAISYSTKPSIWSSGQRVPQTREYLAERGWFHTLANVVTRESVGDGGGIMRLSVRSLLDHGEEGLETRADKGRGVGNERGQGNVVGDTNYTIVADARQATDTTPAMEEYEDGEDENMGDEAEDGAEDSRFSPSRVPKTPGRDKKRVVKGKIGKIGKVKSSSSGAVKKILNPFANLTISK